MATSMQRRTPSTFGLFPLLTRDIDMLQSNMRRIFSQNPMATPDTATGAVPQALTWVPPVEISETPDELIITAEIPGTDTDEVHVTLDGDVLTIRGEKRNVREEGDENTQYYLVERSYGTFQRSFTLPSTVDPESVRAEFDNGVLTLRLRKLDAERARGREIPIGASAGSAKNVGGGSGRSASGASSGSSREASGSSSGGSAREAGGASSGGSSRESGGSSSGGSGGSSRGDQGRS